MPNAVQNPILNKPFECPSRYWDFSGPTPREAEGRRPAGYYGTLRTEQAGGPVAQHEFLPLDLVNLIRPRVDEWRERNWQGVTNVTRDLLEHWTRPDRARQLFFCQREAVETVIWLTEASAADRAGIEVPVDEPRDAASIDKGYRALPRFCAKMATGSGTTTVMAMLSAWSILNKLANRQDARFSDAVLVVGPNLTVKERLGVLDPRVAGNYYEAFDIVPASYRDALANGRVFITNWHAFLVRDESDPKRRSVVRRGRESDAAFVKRVIGRDLGNAANLLVLNDEAHHAYRRGAQEQDDYAEDDETAEANAREATVWIAGLDRIHKVLGGRSPGIRLCVDLSATPFYIQGSGNEVGKPFPWVVSDFSLLEAIEAGLVKVPQLPTEDSSQDDTPRYFNVWRWVQRQAQGDGLIGPVTVTEVMRYATAPVVTLAASWRETYSRWKKHFAAGNRQDDVPPVFIIVCRDTTIAKALHAWLADGDPQYGAGIPEFRNKSGEEYTVRIDSKVGADIDAGGTQDETRRLRFVLETIGKTRWPGGKVPEEYQALVERNNRKALEDEDHGPTIVNAEVPPGRNIRCIISVAMLSEGWDATTVTHVVGLRPFGSQLLCEQVVGRALRRTSYAVNPESGMFVEETAQIFGVPFELIPFKVEGGKPQPPTPPANHVHADPDKAEYELEFPVVEGYQDPGVVSVRVNWDVVGELPLDSREVPDDVLMRGLASYDGNLIAYGPGSPVRVNLEAWRRGVRIQQVAFDLAKVLTNKWREDRGDGIPTHRLFPQMLEAALRFVETRVAPVGTRQVQDVALNPYFDKAVAMLVNAMEVVDGGGRSQEQAVIASGAAGVRSTGLVDFHTGKDLHPAKRCHLNAAVIDFDWERYAGELLDAHPAVRAWVKNDRLGLVVPYRKDGVPRNYLPDFLVELVDGRKLLVEIKGQLGDALLKKAAAERWCRAVTNDRRFGQWSYHLCVGKHALRELLDRMQTVAA